jgi:hypothetical protein
MGCGPGLDDPADAPDGEEEQQSGEYDEDAGLTVQSGRARGSERCRRFNTLLRQLGLRGDCPPRLCLDRLLDQVSWAYRFAAGPGQDHASGVRWVNGFDCSLDVPPELNNREINGSCDVADPAESRADVDDTRQAAGHHDEYLLRTEFDLDDL